MEDNVTVAAATLSATLESVSTFVSSLEARLDRLQMATRTGIVLAVQELLVNIVVHAYARQPGDIRIQITMYQGTLQVIVEDDAPNAYDATRPVQPPDLTDLPENGMGMFIIQQTFEQVDYARLAAGNQWHLQKHIGAVS